MGVLLDALEEQSGIDPGATSLRKESTLTFQQVRKASVEDFEDMIRMYAVQRESEILGQLRSAMAGRFSWPLSEASALKVYPDYEPLERIDEVEGQLTAAVAALRKFVLGDVYAQAYLVTGDAKWNARSVALLGDPQHPGGVGDAQSTLDAVKDSLETAITNYKGDKGRTRRLTSLSVPTLVSSVP